VRNGTTTLLSVLPNGNTAGQSSGAIISADGRHVAFMSGAGLLSLDTDSRNDVYVYDTTTHGLSLASVNLAGTNGGNGDSGFTTNGSSQAGGLAFSADGNSLVFASFATNLTPNVKTSRGNLYLRNLTADTTTLLTPTLAGTDGGNGSPVAIPALSADGRYAAFDSTASNLVLNDDNGASDVFIRDVTAGTTTLASVRSPQLPAAYAATSGSNLGSVSANGRYVAFTSGVFFGQTYSDLAPGVTFSSGFPTSHVFVRDLQTGAIQVVDLNSNGVAVGGYDPVISPDGRYVAFVG
jgi:Tol biopolymer transport system component